MRRLLVAFLVISGCHKDARTASPKDADALWALTPEGAQLGIVITPRGLAMVEHGWADLHAFVDKAPDLKPVAQLMDQQLAQLTGAPDFKLADYGLTSEKGGAVFVVGPQQVVMVVPLADRDKFLAKTHGTKGTDGDTIDKATCKTVQNVYACASSAELFGKLGKGKLRDKLDARGDIEIVAEGIPGMPMKSAAGVVQLERGTAVVRGTFDGFPKLAAFGAPIKPVVDREHAAGFLAINVGTVLGGFPDVPIVTGVTAQQLAKSLAGPITMTVAAGDLAFDLRAPLSDSAPAQALIDHCNEAAPFMTTDKGICHFAFPDEPITFDMWIADDPGKSPTGGKTLHLGMQHPPAPASVPLTPVGAELAEGAWNFVFWGRGSLYAVPPRPLPADAGANPMFHVGMRVFAMMNEMGFGVRLDGTAIHVEGILRTAWANPDDVVARLTAFDPADVFAGKGSAVTAGLPSGAPLARDLTAGYGGLIVPALSLVAISSGVPAFYDTVQKSKRPIVEDDLRYIQTALEHAWKDHKSFPVGDAPLTPEEGCMCKPPTMHCTGSFEKDWSKGPWGALQFMPSEPALFRFSYHSDGKKAEVDAVGDMDCDGIMITYRLKVDATSGTPQSRIEAPPPNTD